MKMTLLFPDCLANLFPPEKIAEKVDWVHDFMDFLLRKNDQDQYMVTEYLQAKEDDPNLRPDLAQNLRPDLAQNGYFTYNALYLLIRERPDTQVCDIVDLVDLLYAYGCMIYITQDFHHGVYLCPLMLKVKKKADGSVYQGPLHEDPYRLVVTTDFPALRMERDFGPNEHFADYRDAINDHPHYAFNAALALIGDCATFCYEPLTDYIGKDWAQCYFGGFLVHIMGGGDHFADKLYIHLTPYDDCPRSEHGQILRSLCWFLERLPGASITLYANSGDGHVTKNVITSKSTNDQLFKD